MHDKITPAQLDQAAMFMQKQMGDALWSRLSESVRDKYRKKVIYILVLCGFGFDILPDGSWKE